GRAQPDGGNQGWALSVGRRGASLRRASRPQGSWKALSDFVACTPRASGSSTELRPSPTLEKPYGSTGTRIGGAGWPFQHEARTPPDYVSASVPRAENRCRADALFDLSRRAGCPVQQGDQKGSLGTRLDGILASPTIASHSKPFVSIS